MHLVSKYCDAPSKKNFKKERFYLALPVNGDFMSRRFAAALEGDSKKVVAEGAELLTFASQLIAY